MLIKDKDQKENRDAFNGMLPTLRSQRHSFHFAPSITLKTPGRAFRHTT